MIKATENSPANKFLLFTVLLTIVLYYARELLVPLVYSAFFAMLLAPVCCKLGDKGVGRTFSVITCVFILLIALLGIFAIIVSEMSTFVDDLPAVQKIIQNHRGRILTDSTVGEGSTFKVFLPA